MGEADKRCLECYDPFTPIPGYGKKTLYCSERCVARAGRRRKREKIEATERRLFDVERVLERAKYIAESEVQGPATAWFYIKRELLE